MTVAILAVAGIAVLVSRQPELVQKWRTWMLIAPVVGIPVWIGPGTTAVLAAALAVVARDLANEVTKTARRVAARSAKRR